MGWRETGAPDPVRVRSPTAAGAASSVGIGCGAGQVVAFRTSARSTRFGARTVHLATFARAMTTNPSAIQTTRRSAATATRISVLPVERQELGFWSGLVDQHDPQSW